MSRSGELQPPTGTAPASSPDTLAEQKPPGDTSWRWDDWTLRYGQIGNPAGGFLAAGKEAVGGKPGATWATGGNGFTGKADQNGLHMFAGGRFNGQLDADFSKKGGDLSLNYGERKLLNLHGDGDSLEKYNLGLSSPLSLGTDRLLTPELRHSVDGDKTTDTFGLSYKNGPLTQGLTMDLGGGSFGSSLKYKDDKTAVNFAQTFGDKPGVSLDFKGTNPDKSVVSGEASHKDDVSKLKLGYEDGLANGRWNGSVGFTEDPKKGSAFDLGLGWKNDKGGFNVAGHDGGENDRSVKFDWNKKLGKESISANFGVAENDKGTRADMGFKYSPMPELKLGGGMNMQNLDAGGYAAGGNLSADWRSAGLGASVGADGAMGSAPGADSLKLNTELLGRVAPNWYVGGQGSLGLQEGKDPSYFVGGNVTYTPKDWLALSAGLGYGSNGPAARLQADVFGGGVKGGAGGLMDQRKKGGTVSLFAEGSMGGAASPFNGAFGEGKHTVPYGGNGSPQLTLGLGYNF
jgi:hypothetical protein